MKPPEPDPAFEISLRPPAFSEFTGQVKVRERLELMVEAAKKRGDVLEHVLLSGPSGLGKTTLAYIIANATGANIKNTSGPVIEKAGELAGLLTSLEKGDVLFIDEIHRLQPAIEEYLYPAMEDYRLDIIIDQGPQARSLRLNLPKFTLVGATTRAGMVSAPLRSRFGMTARLDYYNAEQMQKIIVRSANLLGVEIDQAGAAEIGTRSRGTPRTANNLLRWVRDYVQVKAEGKITAELADRALAMLDTMRERYRGMLMLAGGFDRDSAEAWLRNGRADLIAFGRKFLANPDLPERLRGRAPFNAGDPATYYGGGAGGYTDNYQRQETRQVDRQNYDLKMNWNRTSSQQIWGKFSHMNAVVDDLTNYLGPDPNATGDGGKTKVYQLTSGMTWTLKRQRGKSPASIAS